MEWTWKTWLKLYDVQSILITNSVFFLGKNEKLFSPFLYSGTTALAPFVCQRRLFFFKEAFHVDNFMWENVYTENFYSIEHSSYTFISTLSFYIVLLALRFQTFSPFIIYWTVSKTFRLFLYTSFDKRTRDIDKLIMMSLRRRRRKARKRYV